MCSFYVQLLLFPRLANKYKHTHLRDLKQCSRKLRRITGINKYAKVIASTQCLTDDLTHAIRRIELMLESATGRNFVMAEEVLD